MTRKKVFLFLGPLWALLLYFCLINQGLTDDQSKTAAVLLWVGFWWMTEPVNLYITSLLPLVLLPLLNVMTFKDVAPHYMEEVIFLFIGGFLFAFAMEKWNLHNRIALGIIAKVGHTPTTLLFGVMGAAFFISMWINNTATTAMLIPAVLAIVAQVESKNGNGRIAVPLLIGLAFSASIGGMATLIGTAPNMIFLSQYEAYFPNEKTVSFADWMLFALPIALLIFFACFIILKFLHRKVLRETVLDKHLSEKMFSDLGKKSYEEKWMIFFFILIVVLWFFLKDISFGSFTLYGWPHYLGIKNEQLTEAWVAMVIVMFLFFVPSKSIKNDTLLSWKEVKKLPVGIIFLFGGGFAIAAAVKSTGLSDELSKLLEGFKEFSPLLMVLLICTLITFISEFASNTAALQLVFPILAAFVVTVDVHPLQILIPATLAASCGFMLPVATPPNTNDFGSEKIKASEMMRSGFFLDLAGILIISAAAFTIVTWVMGL
jgi:sodium-dependent dicarboxylate transporter 2/3/5